MPEATSVLFVCLHGSGKSVVAAAQLRRLARERGVAIEADAAGIEPDDAIPEQVVAGLAAEGMDVPEPRPLAVSAAKLAAAGRVVLLGCELSTISSPERAISRWDDIPAVSDGYAAARDVIVGRVAALLDELTAGS